MQRFFLQIASFKETTSRNILGVYIERIPEVPGNSDYLCWDTTTNCICTESRGFIGGEKCPGLGSHHVSPAQNLMHCLPSWTGKIQVLIRLNKQLTLKKLSHPLPQSLFSPGHFIKWQCFKPPSPACVAQQEPFQCTNVMCELVQLLTTVSSLPAALRNALVHLIFLGFRFFLKFLWHFDLQNLNILKKGMIKKKSLSEIKLFVPHCKCDIKHWGYSNNTAH